MPWSSKTQLTWGSTSLLIFSFLPSSDLTSVVYYSCSITFLKLSYNDKCACVSQMVFLLQILLILFLVLRNIFQRWITKKCWRMSHKDTDIHNRKFVPMTSTKWWRHVGGRRNVDLRSENSIRRSKPSGTELQNVEIIRVAGSRKFPLTIRGNIACGPVWRFVVDNCACVDSVNLHWLRNRI